MSEESAEAHLPAELRACAEEVLETGEDALSGDRAVAIKMVQEEQSNARTAGAGNEVASDEGQEKLTAAINLIGEVALARWETDATDYRLATAAVVATVG
jgi:hypothetical protein